MAASGRLDVRESTKRLPPAQDRMRGERERAKRTSSRHGDRQDARGSTRNKTFGDRGARIYGAKLGARIYGVELPAKSPPRLRRAQDLGAKGPDFEILPPGAYL